MGMERASQPEIIADYACEIGENPLWHPTERAVYWCDIPKGRLFRYSPATGDHEQIYEGEVIGGFTFQEAGGLLLFMGKGAIKWWRDGELTTILEEIPDERETRFNDVIADPEGRVFCGTMSTAGRPGRLYRLDPPCNLVIAADGIGCSNGLGFSPDLKQMYYTDSFAYRIYLYDYDRHTGEISNGRVWVQGPESDGYPDGLTIDAEGYAWSAKWDGSSLVRYAPGGAEDRRIHLPARKVSSACFGGDELTDIYVTSAGGDHKETEGPAAGALFRVAQKVRGRPEWFSRISLANS